MKTKLFCIIVIFIFTTIGFSQIDTTTLSYYPLNDGDYWEYVKVSTDYLNSPPTTCYKYNSHKVTGDAIFPLAGQFKFTEKQVLAAPNPQTYPFERADTVSCDVYRYDAFRDTVFLIDSLRASSGDRCNAGCFGYDFCMFKTYCADLLNAGIHKHGRDGSELPAELI